MIKIPDGDKRLSRDKLGNGNRKSNSFYRKCDLEIKNTNDEMQKEVAFAMFMVSHAVSHNEYLLDHFNEEPNYKKTYINTKKCCKRFFRELLYIAKKKDIRGLSVMVNRQSSREANLWTIVLKMEINEVEIFNVIDYKDVMDVLSLDDLDCLDYTVSNENFSVYLGGRELDTQQFFTKTLNWSLENLDASRDRMMLINSRSQK